MRRKLIYYFIVVRFLSLPAFLGAQQLQDEISKNQSKIKTIQNEIKAYENKLAGEQKKEKTELQQLNETNRKIGLLNQLIGSLEKNRELSELSVRSIQKSIGKTRGEQEYYKKIIAQRLVQIYKRRDDNPLAFILTSQSFTQAYSRNKYLKIIAEQDKKDITALREKFVQLERQRKEKEELLSLQKETIRQKQEESRVIQSEIKKRTTTLQQIRKNKKSLGTLIEERREDMQTLQTLIAELERKRKEAESSSESKTSVSGAGKIQPANLKLPGLGSSKGRIPYPVNGRITIKYGNQVHPVLGTKTFYPGVGILTADKAPVHSVAKGVVSLITYLRRFGNTVIIDHGGSFYTVYAHLGEIYVSNGETVKAGDMIARVDQSDDGRSILHFEIYKDKEAVDPSGWLK